MSNSIQILRWQSKIVCLLNSSLGGPSATRFRAFCIVSHAKAFQCLLRWFCLKHCNMMITKDVCSCCALSPETSFCVARDSELLKGPKTDGNSKGPTLVGVKVNSFQAKKLLRLTKKKEIMKQHRRDSLQCIQD